MQLVWLCDLYYLLIHAIESGVHQPEACTHNWLLEIAFVHDVCMHACYVSVPDAINN